MNNNFRPIDALRHPLWWIMLVLLICNDFVLKSAGLMPGWLTGKLSDFAGLMVFPLFAALLFGGRKWVWLALHLLTAAGFAALKLFPEVGGVYVQMLGLFGIQGQVWYDATDLIALLCLPVSYWIYPRLRPIFGLPKKQMLLRSAAIAIAGFACIASGGVSAPRTLTSYNGDLMVSDVMFINGTNGEISVQVARLKDNISVDCSQPITPENFNDKQFTSLGTWKQKSGEATTLLPVATRESGERSCHVVKLTINDIESVMVVWDSNKLQTADVPIHYDLPITPSNIPDNAIVLHREKNDYYMLSKGDFVLTYWRRDQFAIDYWKL
jgi:hypothetical protein